MSHERGRRCIWPIVSAIRTFTCTTLELDGFCTAYGNTCCARTSEIRPGRGSRLENPCWLSLLSNPVSPATRVESSYRTNPCRRALETASAREWTSSLL